MAETGKLREAVGVFEDTDALNKAVEELEHTKFAREDISILGTREDIREKFGEPEVRPEAVEDNPEAPRSVPVRPEEKAIGSGAAIAGGAYLGAVGALLASGAAVAVPAVLTAAAIGAGGGGLLTKILGDKFNDETEKQIQKGGMVLWVLTRSAETEAAASEILRKHGAKHVHIHESES